MFEVNEAGVGSCKGASREVLQLMAKGYSLLHKHLLTAKKKKTAKYTSKTVQNEILYYTYLCILAQEKINWESLCQQIAFIADETTNRHSYQEILSASIRYVDLASPSVPHIVECFISFIYLERANSSTISRKIIKALTPPSVTLDPSDIRGQTYNGAAATSSEMAVLRND